MRHPKEMGKSEVAGVGRIVVFYKEVLCIELPWLDTCAGAGRVTNRHDIDRLRKIR
jgi:hypothetical protein